MFSLIKEKFKNTIYAIGFIFIPMWLVFVFNNGILNDAFLNILGIHPRVVEWNELIGIMGSWMIHRDSMHIVNNSIALFGLVLFVGLLEKNYIQLFLFLIATSGASTWVLGSSHSVIIGASGLLFALFGYVISSALLGRKLIYLIPIIASLSYYGMSYYVGFLDGLMLKDGVAFSAHFGGLMSGVLVSYYFGKEEESFVKIVKRKIDNLKYSIQNKFK